MADIRRLIESGIHPPDKRSPDMQGMTGKTGIYWRLNQ
jgi:hypothetical protein